MTSASPLPEDFAGAPSADERDERSAKRALWSKVWQITAGSVLIIAGVLMLVFPGPGIVTIIAGLAVMAKEVPPAERAMVWMRKRFHDAMQKARDKKANK